MRTTIKTAAVALAISLVSATIAMAQSSDGFKPTGEPIVKVYADYYNALGEYNDLSGFRITRAYLGYGFNLLPELSGKIIIDGSTTLDNGNPRERSVNLKNAYLEWTKGNLTLDAGIHGFLFFGLQEKLWVYRYVDMQFMALYGMAPAADAGVTMKYRFNNWLSTDLSITNGEGYKQLSSDNRLRYSAALVAAPVDGLTLRIYGDIYDRKTAAGELIKSNLMSLYAGYKGRLFSIGGEYDNQHRRHSTATRPETLSGFSLYGTAPLAENWNAFGRFDRTFTGENGWISSMGVVTTGNYIIAGVEYRPMRQLRLAPNYRYSDNRTPTGKHEIYFSAEFNW